MKLFTPVKMFALTMALEGALFASPVLTLDPPLGTISGAPGTTVGWGFTLTNDSGYLVPSKVAFCEGAFMSSGCTDIFGIFTDFAAQDQFIDLGPSGPGSSITETFDDASQQGIGSFLIKPGAVAGDKDIGTIFLIYDVFSCDPVTCPNPTQTGFSLELSAAAEVNVAGSPEPTGTAIAGFAIVIACAIGKSRRSPRIAASRDAGKNS